MSEKDHYFLTKENFYKSLDSTLTWLLLLAFQLWEKINDGNNMPYAIHNDRLQDRETHNSFSIK